MHILLDSSESMARWTEDGRTKRQSQSPYRNISFPLRNEQKFLLIVFMGRFFISHARNT